VDPQETHQKLKDRTTPTSQLLPISRNKSWSGTGKEGKTKEVVEDRKWRVVCERCVWQNYVCERLCVWPSCVRERFSVTNKPPTQPEQIAHCSVLTSSLTPGQRGDRRHHVGLLGAGAYSNTWDEPELQQVLWIERLPLDIALPCCWMLHACRIGMCPVRRVSPLPLPTKRWPQAHKTTSSRTPG